ncbi:MAG TPA: DUF58 domain-containing protein [Candidatus Acidoferrales bacterium]|nr:DUF58 domain-containing protein [Candidatus Acidoferrales bacterium]
MISPDQLVPPVVTAPAEPSPGIPFGFGRSFFLAFLIGLLWAVPAWWAPVFLYGMLAWDLIVLGTWAWDLRRLPPPRALEITRRWQAPADLAAESRVVLELRNRSSVPVVVSVRDDLPAALADEPPLLRSPVPAGGASRLEYSVRPRERGDLRLRNVYLRYGGSWQLAERWGQASLPQTVRIYPSLDEAKRNVMYLIRSRQTVMEKRVKRQRGRGREFESLRDYRQGDEPRDICWTATARRGKPISKVYQVERSQTVWLVLDAGRLLRARSGELSKLDYAAAAALSLAQVALYSGDAVGLLAYGRRLQQRVPAGRGPGQMPALLAALALVRGEEVEANHAVAAEALLTLQKPRSLVVWLSDLAEAATVPEVVENASRMARRHLVLLAVIGQPEMRSLLARNPETAGEMYRYVAAQEIVHRRDLLLRGLRQQGALAIETDPSRLSTALVNQYLEAKERGLL